MVMSRRAAAAGRVGLASLRLLAASREVTEDDLPLIDAPQVPIGRLHAEACERASLESAGQLGYPSSRARFTPWISVRHGAVNTMLADCRMPW
jgi:hypothetical protein